MISIFNIRNTIEIDKKLRTSFMSNVLFDVETLISFLISIRIHLPNKGHFQ